MGYFLAYSIGFLVGAVCVLSAKKIKNNLTKNKK